MADLISLPVALQRVDREVPRNKNGNEIKDEWKISIINCQIKII